ncbi:ribbon-helix-helix domain-containing protein [Elstera litoralis]|uniref:ribbon-helix-helix domain-containing protein n=1 Tax=Elstera litoralis TaxID=552518 RepID=UPI000697EC8E|nr:ribbon-helix-helix domain-containing protein [Elstera litoralis]
MSIFEQAMRHMVDTHRDSALVLRNVTVKGKRTTIRLEPEMWDALAEIARREGYTQTQLCTRIADGQPPGLSFTASVRMFILTYFRTAAHGTSVLSLLGPREPDLATDFEVKHGTR